MKIYYVLISIIFFAISCASSDKNSSNNVQSNQSANLICEKVITAGSRLPKRVCYEKGMKETIEKKSKEALKREQNRNRTRVGSPSE
tara:strand:- start:60 stop:320 length:261 start_codon:yes stop_codon:yes gene_type:complete